MELWGWRRVLVQHCELGTWPATITDQDHLGTPVEPDTTGTLAGSWQGRPGHESLHLLPRKRQKKDKGEKETQAVVHLDIHQRDS